MPAKNPEDKIHTPRVQPKDKPKKLKIFISHSSEDEKLAAAWSTLLSEIGQGQIVPWAASDPVAIRTGESWRKRIFEEIKQSTHLIALITPSSIRLPWVAFECGAAAIDGNREVIPIAYDLRWSDIGQPLAYFQGRSGEDRAGIEALCQQLLKDCGLAQCPSEIHNALSNFHGSVGSYKRQRESSLIHDDEMKGLLGRLDRGIGLVSSDSILRGLVMNEVQRIADRIAQLEIGKFELRNEKPPEEIIAYYSRYLDQLAQGTCHYYTISTRRFWLAITDDGKNQNYLEANERAADRNPSTTIGRVFLLDQKEFSENTVVKDKPFASILERHFVATKRSRGRIKTRVHFSENYAVDRQTYGNFAVWMKDQEEVLILPQYTTVGGSNRLNMSVTNFAYSQSRDGKPKHDHNHEDIMKKLGHYNSVNDRSEELSVSHFS